MSKIYDTQTVLKFIACTHTDITGASARKIKYKKPDGTTGEWTASEEGDPLIGKISYEIIAALGSFNGWTLWAWIEFSAGNSIPGEARKITVYEEGT